MGLGCCHPLGWGESLASLLTTRLPNTLFVVFFCSDSDSDVDRISEWKRRDEERRRELEEKRKREQEEEIRRLREQEKEEKEKRKEKAEKGEEMHSDSDSSADDEVAKKGRKGRGKARSSSDSELEMEKEVSTGGELVSNDNPPSLVRSAGASRSSSDLLPWSSVTLELQERDVSMGQLFPGLWSPHPAYIPVMLSLPPQSSFCSADNGKG